MALTQLYIVEMLVWVRSKHLFFDPHCLCKTHTQARPALLSLACVVLDQFYPLTIYFLFPDYVFCGLNFLSIISLFWLVLSQTH
jgi:hypothetical protein